MASGFDILLRAAKSNFFDRTKVHRAMDATAKKALSKFGAFVRQRAKTSMRKRRGSSPPGTPPNAHVGYLRKFLYFGYDTNARSVVIGPVLIRPGSRCPNVEEYGGSVPRPGTLLRFRRKNRMVYPPRPYMRPAFETEKKNLAVFLEDSIR